MAYGSTDKWPSVEGVLDKVLPWTLVAIGVAFGLVMMIVAYTVLAERKILGWIQGR